MNKLKKSWMLMSAYIGTGLATIVLVNVALRQLTMSLLPVTLNGVMLLFLALLFLTGPIINA